MWAEWYRGLAEAGIPPMEQLPRHVWRYRLSSLEVADLGDEARLGRLGLSPPTPARKTWRPYQAVGEQLWREGWPGLLAPSAARPEGRVLCLFVEDPVNPPARPIGRSRIVAEPPAPPTGMRT